MTQKEARIKYQTLSKEKKKQKKVWERYQNFTEEEKEKSVQFYCARNKNLSKEQK